MVESMKGQMMPKDRNTLIVKMDDPKEKLTKHNDSTDWSYLSYSRNIN